MFDSTASAHLFGFFQNRGQEIASKPPAIRHFIRFLFIVPFFGHGLPLISINRNYSGMLIGLPIAILYFLARKITAEGAGAPSKVHTRQLVKIQPEERLATTSELNPTPSQVTG